MEPLQDSDRLRIAKESLVAAMPSKDHYLNLGVAPDLISGLQKRDTKWQTCISSTLILELGDALLPTTLLDLSFKEATEMRNIHAGTIKNIPNIPVLANILQRLDAIWPRSLTDPNERAPIFVKLSFMSPKDQAIHPSFESSRKGYEQRLQSLWESSSLIDRLFNYHRIMTHPTLRVLWLNALNNSLQIRSPLDALKLLCSSSRCQEELNDAIIDENVFRLNIVLRPWVQIKPGFEFRIYVCNGSITCASQYEPVHFPAVWEMRNTLPSLIGGFVRDRVIPRLKHRLPSFVVDVVMLADGRDTLAVCELNPFAASSSACLFSWHTDMQLLLLGPETWRFAPPEMVGSDLASEWQEVTRRYIKAQHAKLATKCALIGATAFAVGAALWNTKKIV